MFLSVLVLSIKNPVSRYCFVYRNSPDSYQGLKICASLCLQRRNWCIFKLLSTFIVITHSFFVVMLVSNVVGGSEKFESFICMYFLRQSVGKGRVFAHRGDICRGVEKQLHSFLNRPAYIRSKNRSECHINAV